MFKKGSTSQKLKEAADKAIKTFSTTIQSLRDTADQAEEEKIAVVIKRKELEEEESNLTTVADEANKMANAIEKMLQG